MVVPKARHGGLVDRSDHSHNFGIYHPTGKGGRDIWGGGKAGRQGKIK